MSVSVKVDGLIDTRSARSQSKDTTCTEHHSRVNTVDAGCFSKVEDQLSIVGKARTNNSVTAEQSWASGELLEVIEAMPTSRAVHP